jgi:hypothetical protein
MQRCYVKTHKESFASNHENQAKIKTIDLQSQLHLTQSMKKCLDWRSLHHQTLRAMTCMKQQQQNRWESCNNRISNAPIISMCASSKIKHKFRPLTYEWSSTWHTPSTNVLIEGSCTFKHITLRHLWNNNNKIYESHGITRNQMYQSLQCASNKSLSNKSSDHWLTKSVPLDTFHPATSWLKQA